MSGRKLRWLTVGLFASAGAGVLSLTSMMNSAYAFGDAGIVGAAAADPNIGLVMGASGLPIPGPLYVEAANGLYLDNPDTMFYPDLTFYQATSTDPTDLGFFGNGLFTPEGLYPLTASGVHQLLLNYPTDPTTGFPALSSSVGQGMFILESAINADTAAGDASTVFGYSQSSTIASQVMQQLDPSGTPDTTPEPLNFLLIADPSAPNGGLLERFNGFETLSGQTTVDPLSLPSLGFVFDGATPANDFPTDIYSLEYDGFTDFPRYPLNFLADVNAFLGIADLHGTYLTNALNGAGPSAAQIAAATANPLPGSAVLGTPDSLTNYYMIPETAPLVSTLEGISKPLGDLLGPDLTVLINLGYGTDNLGYSTPADVPTPFGLFPDFTPATLSDLFTNLEAGAQQGLTAFESDLSNPSALLSSLYDPTSLSTLFASFADLATPAAITAASVDPPSFTEIVNAFSSAASTAYSTLLPLADVGNAALTSLPAYDLSLFTDNLQTGDLLDAFGLPVAANTALDTIFAGFSLDVISTAASQIAADFASIGF